MCLFLLGRWGGGRGRGRRKRRGMEFVSILYFLFCPFFYSGMEIGLLF